jgi:CRP/FNR family cyclic AMP-dependent transcriptional regulator
MARGDEKLEHLRSVRLFSAASKKELGVLGRAADEVTVDAGHELTKEGAVGHEFFVIMEGEADVKMKGRKVATLGKGQSFGELALLDKGPRNATVTAKTPMTVLVLGQREFAAVLDEVPTLTHKLLQAMAARLREADAKAVQ